MDSFGCSPVNVEHVPHAVHTSTRSGTSTLCNEFRPLALSDDETAGAVTRDTAQQMYAGAICQPSASWRSKLRHPSSPTLGNPSLNQLPVWRMFDNIPADVLIPCPPAVTAQASGGREPCVRACPHSNSSVDMHVGASTQPKGTLDEDTFRQQYGETVHHRTIDHAKTVGGI